jgi:hypothetical protein
MFSMTWRRSRGRFDLRSDGGQGYPILMTTWFGNGYQRECQRNRDIQSA